MLNGAKDVLRCQKARLYGVDFNSLGQPKELWVLGGETGNIGLGVPLDEWGGYVAKAKAPVFSNAPREDKLWGSGYLQMEKSDKKFKWTNLVAVGIHLPAPKPLKMHNSDTR